jgi:hypothetical protein
LVEVHTERDERLNGKASGPVRADPCSQPVRDAGQNQPLGEAGWVLERLEETDRLMALFERDQITEWLWLRSHAWPAEP